MKNPHKVCSCAQGEDCHVHGLFECHVPCTPPPNPSYFFAPGTVETPSLTTRTDTVGRWLLTAAVLAAIAAAIGMSAGWLTVGGVL